MWFCWKAVLLMVVVALSSCATVQQTRIEEHKAQPAKLEETPESRDSDASLAESIVGTWVYEKGAFRGETTCFADGRFESVGSIPAPGGMEGFRLKGTWRVENGRLIETASETSHPEVIPIGESTTDRIVSVTGDELVLVVEDGEKIVERRKRPESPLMSELYAKTRMRESLSHISASVLNNFDDRMKRLDKSQRPPDQMIAMMKAFTEGAFAAEKLKESILQDYEAGLSPEEIQAVIDWYDSPLGRRCKALSLAASAPEAQAEKKAYVNGLRHNPPPTERFKLVQQLNRALQDTESTVTFLLGVQLADAAGLMALLPPEKQEPVARSMEVIEQQRPTLEIMYEPIVTGETLYKYQSLSISELAQFVEFQTSEIGRKYNGVRARAYQKAVFDATARYWQSLIEVMKSTKKPSASAA